MNIIEKGELFTVSDGDGYTYHGIAGIFCAKEDFIDEDLKKDWIAGKLSGKVSSHMEFFEWLLTNPKVELVNLKDIDCPHE